jgi:hypothetical protein
MSTSTVIEVDPVELLNFFDEVPPGSSGHATAIVAVAGEELGACLIVDYLRSVGRRARVLPGPCKPLGRSGARLDRWIEVADDPPLLYQVEVKNWSAHAIGGKRLLRGASAVELADYATRNWASFWDGQTFTNPSMQKVLTRMQPPYPNCRVEPLIAFWGVVHATDALFAVPVSGNANFRQVFVFSMSSYLRRCAGRKLVLEMPLTVKRLEWLHRLFPIVGPVSPVGAGGNGKVAG